MRGITDFHIHFCDPRRLDELVKFCDTSVIARCGLVSLPDQRRGNFNDGVLGAVKADPGRFFGFGCLDHRLARTEKGGAVQVRQLAAAGFNGLKLWLGKPAVERDFGVKMEDRYVSGAVKAAGDLGMPVLIHLADPPEFWKPGGPLYHPTAGASSAPTAPDHPGNFASWIDRGREFFAGHPDTEFIGAHLLFLGGGLKKLDKVMENHPNLMLDFAPGRWFYRVLAEEKSAAEAFIIRWADRLLLGSDSFFFPPDYTTFPPGDISKNRDTLDRILRFLGHRGIKIGISSRAHEAPVKETYIDDPFPWPDYKDHSENEPPRLPCLGLDKETLGKITADNADRFFKES